ncbi:hypothetical protein HA466_0011980 [Hirschfeldia incana]|nr:hypothetical protein HA466_0011980 [Hirschfeldia incana]
MERSLRDAGVERELSLMFKKRRRTHTEDSSDIKKENHLFKWVDEALLDEIERMAANQARVDEQIEDLKISMKKTVQEEVMKYKKSLDLGCVGTLFSLLCLCSKDD